MRANANSQPGPMTADMPSVQKDLARIRLQQAAQHIYGGRLACTIWSQQSEDLAVINLQVEVVHGNQAAIVLGDGFGLKNNVFHGLYGMIVPSTKITNHLNSEFIAEYLETKRPNVSRFRNEKTTT